MLHNVLWELMVLKCVLIVIMVVGGCGWFDWLVGGWVGNLWQTPGGSAKNNHTHTPTWWWQPLPPQRLPPTWPLLVKIHKEGGWWWWWWRWCWCWCGVGWLLLLGMCLMAVVGMLWQMAAIIYETIGKCVLWWPHAKLHCPGFVAVCPGLLQSILTPPVLF